METIQRPSDEAGSDFSDEDKYNEQFCNKSSHSSEREISEFHRDEIGDSKTAALSITMKKNCF